MLHLNHLYLAHLFWEKHLKPTDWVIDATLGTGQDCKKLAELTPLGGVIAIDIQQEALKKAKIGLEGLLDRVHFFCQSHEEFPAIVFEHPISLVVYNLGYLPGGEKTLTTKVSSTLKSVEQALSILKKNGILSITCYPGHFEGLEEKEALMQYFLELNQKKYCVYNFCHLVKMNAPNLLIIKKLK